MINLKFKDMKKGILLIVLILSLYVSLAWALVSFIIYLVKDIPFDFISLYIASIIAIILVVWNVYAIIELKNKPIEFKKSAFQSRLDEMAEQKRNNLK